MTFCKDMLCNIIALKISLYNYSHDIFISYDQCSYNVKSGRLGEKPVMLKNSLIEDCRFNFLVIVVIEYSRLTTDWTIKM